MKEKLTEWADFPPPSIGWWETRFKGDKRPKTSRRWWDGKSISMPVNIGDSDATADARRVWESPRNTDQFEWRGLSEPLNPSELPT